MFSTGMPILLLFGGLCLTSRYLTDKFTCLRIFSRPAYVDSSLNDITLKWMPTIFSNHIFWAILMLSTPSIFPQRFNEQDLDGHFLTGEERSEYNFSLRFLSHNTRVHCVIWISVWVLWCFDTWIYDYVKRYFIDLVRNDPNVVSMKLYGENQGTYKEVKEDIKKYMGLNTYDIMKNDEYKYVMYAMSDFLDGRASKKLTVMGGKTKK